MFTESANPDMQTQMFELFSGHGAVSGVFRRAGVATVSYDINMDKGKRTMDFLTEGGFASKPYLLIMNDLSLYELLSNLLTIVSTCRPAGLQVVNAVRHAGSSGCFQPGGSRLRVMDCGFKGYFTEICN